MAEMAALKSEVAAIKAHAAQIEAATDIFYYMICGCMVFLMQLGFAMLEVGTVSKKNINNIILKGTLDILIGGVCWWAVGFTVAFGGDYNGGFIGGPDYAFGRCLDGFGDNLHQNRSQTNLGFQDSSDCQFQQWVRDKDVDGTWNGDWKKGEMVPLDKKYHEWFFQFAFAATAATIVSGAMAERTTTLAYTIYSIVLTMFVYPVVVHWQWGGGLTSYHGAVDYAGSGVVHMTGGLAAIVGAALVGPRKWKDRNGVTVNRFEAGICGKVNDVKPFSVVFQTLGTIILWFGWYGFNTGSTLGIVWTQAPPSSTAQSEPGLIIINTTLAPCTAGLTAMLLTATFTLLKALLKGEVDENGKQRGFQIQVGPVLNGILGGLVSITAGCGDVRPGWAALIGVIGGFVYVLSSGLQKMLKIDDVIDAGPVHFWCGIWGVIALGLFADDRGTGLTSLNDGQAPTGFKLDNGTVVQELGGMGLFWGHGDLLAGNLFLICMICIWVGFTMGVTFGLLKAVDVLLKVNCLRVAEDVELQGLDTSKHGVRSSIVMGQGAMPGFEDKDSKPSAVVPGNNV